MESPRLGEGVQGSHLQNPKSILQMWNFLLSIPNDLAYRVRKSLNFQFYLTEQEKWYSGEWTLDEIYNLQPHHSHCLDGHGRVSLRVESDFCLQPLPFTFFLAFSNEIISQVSFWSQT